MEPLQDVDEPEIAVQARALFLTPLSVPSEEPPVKSVCRINPKLLPVKLLVFLIHGGIAAVFPYFTLHMKSVGITVKEIAVMLMLLPIVSSIGPPLGGWLADRIGNYKIVLIIFTVLSVILHTFLWFGVPFFGVDTKPTEIILANSTFVINFPCNGAPVSLMLPEANTRKLHNCSVLHEWRPAELSNCQSDCKEKTHRICLTGRHVSESYCYEREGMHNLRVTGAKNRNGTWTPSGFNVTWAAAKGDLSNPRCVLNEDEHGSANCSVICDVTSKNEVGCNEFKSVGDWLTTLALYFTWRFVSSTAIRIVFPLSDAAVLEITEKHHGDLGIQKLFVSVGFCVIPPLSGWLIDLASESRGFDDYSPAFYIFGALNLIAAALMICMPFGARKAQSNIWKSLGIVLKDYNVVAFVIMIFVCGAAFGVLVNFLFLFMKEDKEFLFKSPGWLIGLTNTVGYSLGIPLLFFSTQIIRKFGHENIVALGVLCYAARFLAYSFTYKPLVILPTEVFTAVTGMLMVVSSEFPKYPATLVGLFGAVNFGIGSGVGPLVSGFMIHSLGYRTTFRIWSYICTVLGVLYFLVYHLFLKRRKSQIGAVGADRDAPVSGEVVPLEPQTEAAQNGHGRVDSSPQAPRRNKKFSGHNDESQVSRSSF